MKHLVLVLLSTVLFTGCFFSNPKTPDTTLHDGSFHPSLSQQATVVWYQKFYDLNIEIVDCYGDFNEGFGELDITKRTIKKDHLKAKDIEFDDEDKLLYRVLKHKDEMQVFVLPLAQQAGVRTVNRGFETCLEEPLVDYNLNARYRPEPKPVPIIEKPAVPRPQSIVSYPIYEDESLALVPVRTPENGISVTGQQIDEIKEIINIRKLNDDSTRLCDIKSIVNSVLALEERKLTKQHLKDMALPLPQGVTLNALNEALFIQPRAIKTREGIFMLAKLIEQFNKAIKAKNADFTPDEYAELGIIEPDGSKIHYKDADTLNDVINEDGHLKLKNHPKTLHDVKASLDAVRDGQFNRKTLHLLGIDSTKLTNRQLRRAQDKFMRMRPSYVNLGTLRRLFGVYEHRQNSYESSGYQESFSSRDELREEPLPEPSEPFSEALSEDSFALESVPSQSSSSLVSKRQRLPLIKRKRKAETRTAEYLTNLSRELVKEAQRTYGVEDKDDLDAIRRSVNSLLAGKISKRDLRVLGIEIPQSVGFEAVLTLLEQTYYNIPTLARFQEAVFALQRLKHAKLQSDDIQKFGLGIRVDEGMISQINTINAQTSETIVQKIQRLEGRSLAVFNLYNRQLNLPVDLFYFDIKLPNDTILNDQHFMKLVEHSVQANNINRYNELEATVVAAATLVDTMGGESKMSATMLSALGFTQASKKQVAYVNAVLKSGRVKIADIVTTVKKILELTRNR
jgi:hypothetical protein